jgi:hypothetical protein
MCQKSTIKGGKENLEREKGNKKRKSCEEQ